MLARVRRFTFAASVVQPRVILKNLMTQKRKGGMKKGTGEACANENTLPGEEREREGPGLRGSERERLVRRTATQSV